MVVVCAIRIADVGFRFAFKFRFAECRSGGQGWNEEAATGFSWCFCINIGEHAPNVTYYDVGMKKRNSRKGFCHLPPLPRGVCSTAAPKGVPDF